MQTLPFIFDFCLNVKDWNHDVNGNMDLELWSCCHAMLLYRSRADFGTWRCRWCSCKCQCSRSNYQQYQQYYLYKHQCKGSKQYQCQWSPKDWTESETECNLGERLWVYIGSRRLRQPGLSTFWPSFKQAMNLTHFAWLCFLCIYNC